MADIPVHKSSGNLFADIGFTPAEAAALTAKSRLIAAIDETMRRRKLTQMEAAGRCGTDQPTLSKVLRGRMESVTIDRLTALAYRARTYCRNPRSSVRFESQKGIRLVELALKPSIQRSRRPT